MANPALFFDGAPEGFALYAELERRILAAHPQVTVKVQKTQITFSARFGFAWFWLPDRRVKGCPEAKLMVSFAWTIGWNPRASSQRWSLTPTAGPIMCPWPPPRSWTGSCWTGWSRRMPLASGRAESKDEKKLVQKG